MTVPVDAVAPLRSAPADATLRTMRRNAGADNRPTNTISFCAPTF
ncbi:hypothetical protein [Streptomyces sp. NPDC050564]